MPNKSVCIRRFFRCSVLSISTAYKSVYGVNLYNTLNYFDYLYIKLAYKVTGLTLHFYSAYYWLFFIVSVGKICEGLTD